MEIVIHNTFYKTPIQHSLTKTEPGTTVNSNLQYLTSRHRHVFKARMTVDRIRVIEPLYNGIELM